MSIGENLKKFRLQSGLTQVELSEQVGIKQCTLAQYERNTKMIPLSLAAELAKVFGCMVDDFLDEKEV